jgi:NhaP-type Na+/H+ or K+/H+ antiporter
LKLESLKANFIRITNEKVLSGMKKFYLMENIFLKILIIILAIIVVALYAHQLMTGSVELMPYSMLFLAAILLITGLEERQKDRKGVFLRYAVVSLFLCVVSILGFLMD